MICELPQKNKAELHCYSYIFQFSETLTQQCFLLDTQRNQRDITPSSSSQTYLLAGQLMQWFLIPSTSVMKSYTDACSQFHYALGMICYNISDGIPVCLQIWVAQHLAVHLLPTFSSALPLPPQYAPCHCCLLQRSTPENYFKSHYYKK